MVINNLGRYILLLLLLLLFKCSAVQISKIDQSSITKYSLTI